MGGMARPRHSLSLTALALLPLLAACGSQSISAAKPSSSVSTTLSATPSTSSAPSAPTAAQIRQQLANVVEVGYPSTHFSLIDGPVTVGDGAGGAITAVIGVRSPTADAKGQMLFFWHNGKFIGWAPTTEAYAMKLDPRHAAGKIVVDFALYPHGTPLCCPRGSARITYALAATRMRPMKPVPASALSGQAVRAR